MKRPSFQFYPGDWSSNPNLKRCTFAEKGIWLEVLCLMHDQPEYGVLRWPLKEIAEAVKCRVTDLQALQRKDVLKGSDQSIAEPFIYVPRSGRKDGEPVTLVPAQAGPLWYSSRMVKDEYVRTIRGESTRFGEQQGDPPKRAPKPPFGDGSSASSSTSPSGKKQGATAPLSPEATGGGDGPGLLGDAGSPPSVPPCPVQQLVGLFVTRVPELPKPRIELWKDSKGADAMRQRWKWLLSADTRREDGSRYASTAAEAIEWFGLFFDKVHESDFLSGRNGAWKNCDLTWLMNRENFMKVVQGNYENKGTS